MPDSCRAQSEGGKVSNTSKMLYGIFFCFALLFIVTLNLRPFPFVHIVKVIPVYSLAVLVFLNVLGSKGKLIGIGLLFSGVGDIVLELDRGNYFVYGLGAFLVAHLFYIAAFAKNLQIKGPRAVVAMVMIAYGLVVGFFLLPKLGDMLVPVVAYLAVIIAMGIFAALGASNHWLIIVGACFFIASDSIIAVNRFLTPVPASSLCIMLSYYSAQFFITTGALKRH